MPKRAVLDALDRTDGRSRRRSGAEATGSNPVGRANSSGPFSPPIVAGRLRVAPDQVPAGVRAALRRRLPVREGEDVEPVPRRGLVDVRAEHPAQAAEDADAGRDRDVLPAGPPRTRSGTRDRTGRGASPRGPRRCRRRAPGSSGRRLRRRPARWPSSGPTSGRWRAARGSRPPPSPRNTAVLQVFRYCEGGAKATPTFYPETLAGIRALPGIAGASAVSEFALCLPDQTSGHFRHPARPPGAPARRRAAHRRLHRHPELPRRDADAPPGRPLFRRARRRRGAGRRRRQRDAGPAALARRDPSRGG